MNKRSVVKDDRKLTGHDRTENIHPGQNSIRVWIILTSILLCMLLAAGSFIFMPQWRSKNISQRDAHGQMTDITTPPTLATQTITVQKYALPQKDAGVMQPAIDQQGNIWFGEMSLNQLARFDPHTNLIKVWKVPQAQNGIMSTIVDQQDNIWFTEQSGNYIGRFQPQTQQFKQFPLSTQKGQNIGPQGLALDSQGNLWFTAVSSSQIGRLDPATGALRLWSLPKSENNLLYPYSLTITPDQQIWIGMLAGGLIVRFDPHTTQFHLLYTPGTQSEISSMIADTQGNIWFSELQTGVIGKIAATTHKMTEHQVFSLQDTTNQALTLSDIAIAPDGSIWLTCPEGNLFVRLQPTTGVITYLRLSQAQSQPYALSFDTSGQLWFTASGTPDDYVGKILQKSWQ